MSASSKLIVNGEFAEHARLPAETDLARRFNASRPVIRAALARLRDDGVIVSRQGSGSYVKRRPDNAVLRFVPVSSIADIRGASSSARASKARPRRSPPSGGTTTISGTSRRLSTNSATASGPAGSASRPTSASTRGGRGDA